MIETRLTGGVLTARIANPPCNVISLDLLHALERLEALVREDDAIRVLVLESADPDFFLAHFDVSYAASRPAPADPWAIRELNPLGALAARLRDGPKPSIAKLAGRLGGGGMELAAACDMRFGVAKRTVFNQMEVPLGILPAAGGTQALVELVGRGRALEIVLGGDDIDAATAAAWGLLNRVFDDPETMSDFVTALAARIAAWPKEAVACAKRAIGLASPNRRERLLEENRLCHAAMGNANRVPLMQAFLDAGGQTEKGERQVAAMTLANAETLARSRR